MTNKPMLSVERKVIEDILADAREPATDYMAARKVLRALLDNPPHTRQEGYGEAMRKVGDLLDKSVTCAESQVEPAAQQQGEAVAVGRVSYIGNGFVRVRLNGAAPLLESPLFAEQPAPVAVALPFAEKVIAKLQRFEACASDGQDVDIGRHWFDLLTQLELLRRVQRSPAYWEMTQQGEDALKATRLNSPQ